MKIVKFWWHEYGDGELVGVISSNEVSDKVTSMFVTRLNDLYGVSNIVVKGDEVHIHWTDGDKCVSILKYIDVVLNDIKSIEETVKNIR